MWEFNYNWFIKSTVTLVLYLSLNSSTIDEWDCACKASGAWSYKLSMQGNHDNPVRGNHQALSHWNTSVEVHTYILGMDGMGAKPLKKHAIQQQEWNGLTSVGEL